MNIFYSLLFLIATSINIAQATSQNLIYLFRQADSRSIIGTTTQLNLPSSGILVSPLYNDFLGNTDKYLTHSMQFSYLKFLTEQESLQINMRWNALTPAYQTAFGQPYQTNPQGIFADIGELQGSWNLPMPLLNLDNNLRLNLTLGLQHWGNKGAAFLQKSLHQLLKLRYDYLNFDIMPTGLKLSAGLESSYLWGTLNFVIFTEHQLLQQTTFGIYANPLYQELFLRHNFVLELRDQFFLAAELGTAYHYFKGYWQTLNDTRIEESFGIQYGEHYRFTVKCVQPFMQGDPFGQCFIDFANFRWVLD